MFIKVLILICKNCCSLFQGIPGGIDTQQKHCRMDHDEEVNFDMITGNFVLQPVEKMNNQLIKESYSAKNYLHTLNVQNSNCKHFDLYLNLSL